jgi:imidazolonepropionase-like amidohydrolase
MMVRLRFGTCIAIAALAFVLGSNPIVRASRPLAGPDSIAYAIKGARLVTAAGSPINSGTVVLRNGLIEAVGADVSAPADSVIIDGAGLTVYPGLIDMGTSTGLDIQVPTQQPSSVRTFDEAERWKRELVLRSDVMAADHLKLDAAELKRLAAAGITTVLATPPGVLIKGHSALINVATPEDEPIVGAIAAPRAGVSVLKSPVALHVQFQAARTGEGYPVALLGAIAFVRQSFLDAQYQNAVETRYAKAPAGVTRPAFDKALAGLQPALGSTREPVAFEADLQREIIRALDMAKEFGLSPIITGAHEADLVAADLKAQNAKVIVDLNYPSRPKALAPDADEPARELRLRAHAPKVAGGLAKAGVPFAFSSSGLQNASDFVKNAARAVKEGLSNDAAVRALTIDAARIAGVADRLGSLEKGKIANLTVTDGDLFAEPTKIKYVFVDGQRVDIEAPDAPQGRGRGGH